MSSSLTSKSFLPRASWPETLSWTNRYWSLGKSYEDAFYEPVAVTPLNNARLAAVNLPLATELGLEASFLESQAFTAVCNGEAHAAGLSPVATVYSGHQFGVWAGQLGDGRAILLGEQQTASGDFWEWQLKGAGQTPYSRRGDGRAVLRSTIREYLCSEAMNALGIPTTRALALWSSDEPVYRERVETGALLLRLAPSHVRFGHIEHFYYHDVCQGVPDTLEAFLEFVIETYYPELPTGETRYGCFLAEVVSRTAQLIAEWQSVGFNHGVMNTDNMSLLGLTLDYGPFGFLEAYDPQHVCNHSDTHGRYSFQNQPAIGQWNCAALGQALVGVVSVDEINTTVARYRDVYHATFATLMGQKLGLLSASAEDLPLVTTLLQLLAADSVDYTQFFRRWSEMPLQDMVSAQGVVFPTERDAFSAWLDRFLRRLAADPASAWTEQERQAALCRVNPRRVLRNYWAQQVIEAAEIGDFSQFETLLLALQSPFTAQDDWAEFDRPAPPGTKPVCVSCSS